MKIRDNKKEKVTVQFKQKTDKGLKTKSLTVYDTTLAEAVEVFKQAVQNK